VATQERRGNQAVPALRQGRGCECEEGVSPSEFDSVLEKTFERMRDLSTLKGGEYSGDIDRFENFTRNARNLGLTPYQIWAVYAGKHWDALMQFIKDDGQSRERTRAEPIEGRIDDLLVYLCLLHGMLYERRKA
jgi:hypothetical protein